MSYAVPGILLAAQTNKPYPQSTSYKIILRQLFPRIQISINPVLVTNACNTGTQEAEAGRLKIPGQAGICETWSKSRQGNKQMNICTHMHPNMSVYV